MKKIIPFILFLLILSGCSNWKYGGKARPSGNEIRYAEVVVDRKKDEVLVIDLPTIASKDLALTDKQNVQKLSDLEKTPKAINFQKITEIESNDATVNSWIPIQDKVVENEDSLRKQELILQQALATERESKKSTIFGIVGVVLSVTPVFIAGLIFSITGLKKSVRSLKAPYTTPKGLKLAKAGLILSIFGLVLSTIVVILFLVVLMFILSYL